MTPPIDKETLDMIEHFRQRITACTDDYLRIGFVQATGAEAAALLSRINQLTAQLADRDALIALAELKTSPMHVHPEILARLESQEALIVRQGEMLERARVALEESPEPVSNPSNDYIDWWWDWYANERKMALAALGALVIKDAHPGYPKDILDTVANALKPFAKYARFYRDDKHSSIHDNVELWQSGKRVTLTVGDLRAADAAFSVVRSFTDASRQIAALQPTAAKDAGDGEVGA